MGEKSGGIAGNLDNPRSTSVSFLSICGGGEKVPEDGYVEAETLETELGVNDDEVVEEKW